MMGRVRDSQYVLMVCTETYNRRVLGEEVAGRGLGANWEGAIITAELYASCSTNTKFVPVVLSPAARAFVPPFVAGSTVYDVSSTEGYTNLYRVLTSQPRVIKPALGKVKELPPATQHGAGQIVAAGQPTDNVCLILVPGSDLTLTEYESIDVGDRLVAVLRPADAAQVAFLEALRAGRHRSVGLAFGLTAVLAEVEAAARAIVAGGERWTLTLTVSQSDYGAGIMEMGTARYSADQLAEMRARRILLDEPLVQKTASDLDRLNAAAMEVLVRGVSTPLEVDESPLPDLYRDLSGRGELFLVAARLVATLWLRLSGTVEHVLRLDLVLNPDDTLGVTFEGRRHKKYSNAEAPTITVQGTCNLVRDAAT